MKVRKAQFNGGARLARGARKIAALSFLVASLTVALLLVSQWLSHPLAARIAPQAQVVLGAAVTITHDDSPELARAPESQRVFQSNADDPPNADDPRIRRTRLRIIWGLVEQVWGWLILAAIAFGGLSPRLRDLSYRLGGKRFGALSPYIIVLSLLLALLSAPISFYRDFVLEHEFGLSNQDVASWLRESVISVGLAIITGLIIYNIIYFLVRRAPRRWWLHSALIVIVFSVITGALAPVLITPLFNKFDPLQDGILKERVLELAQQGGVQVADVQQVDMSRQTKAANAYFIGIGPTKRIVLGDTLLENFSHDEVLTVVAHEMGHQAHEDIWRIIGAGAILFLFAFYVLYRSLTPLIDRFQHRLRFSRLEDPASLPLALLLVGLLFFLTQPVQNTFSRYIEHQADRYALELTRENEVYAGALDKLGRVNVSDPDPPAWMEFMFFTHPSLKNRVEFARSYRPWEDQKAAARSVASPSSIIFDYLAWRPTIGYN